MELLDFVASSLEDNRAGVVFSSIDFSKTFNRLDHTECLKCFADRGLSREVVLLLGAFLSGRTMTVRVGECRSVPKPVNAGAPQGSVLGCYLFNVAIDKFEEGTTPNPQSTSQQETLSHAADYPAASTPARVAPLGTDPVDMSPIDRADQPEFEFLPRAKTFHPGHANLRTQTGLIFPPFLSNL